VAVTWLNAAVWGTSLMYRTYSSELTFVDCLWHIRVEALSAWTDTARETWGLAFTRRTDGSMAAELVGPSYRHMTFGGDLGDEYWGADFHPHVTMRGVDKPLLTGKFVPLPVADGHFWIGAVSYRIPAFSELEAFLAELAFQGQISDRANAVLNRETVSPRSNQRRYREAVGLSRRQSEQIRRAAKAAALLKSGKPPVEVAAEAGYADQAHLTRSLKRLLGKTPGRISSPE
jgi:AraC-like DNA-binding protein